MSVVAEHLAREYPNANRDRASSAVHAHAGHAGRGTGSILALWQTSALVVMLIACANSPICCSPAPRSAGATDGRRLALGASRGRVVRTPDVTRAAALV